MIEPFHWGIDLMLNTFSLSNKNIPFTNPQIEEGFRQLVFYDFFSSVQPVMDYTYHLGGLFCGPQYNLTYLS